jgi:hypothetical protein
MGCAYYEGYWTAQEGAGAEANPYRQAEAPALWQGWLDGWEDAQAEGRVSDR